MFKLKIIKHYERAIRIQTLKGFELCLPLCKYVSINNEEWAEVNKEFFFLKKAQALKRAQEFRLKRGRDDEGPILPFKPSVPKQKLESQKESQGWTNSAQKQALTMKGQSTQQRSSEPKRFKPGEIYALYKKTVAENRKGLR